MWARMTRKRRRQPAAKKAPPGTPKSERPKVLRTRAMTKRTNGRKAEEGEEVNSHRQKMATITAAAAERHGSLVRGTTIILGGSSVRGCA
jgi:hypothetical protein